MNSSTSLAAHSQGSTAAGLRSRLNDLAGAVAEQRAGFDAAGRLPDGLYRALAKIGLFRLFVPKALGGPELSALEFMDVVEDAAALEGAIGWLAGNGGGMGRVGAYLARESAEEIFADPHAFVVSSTGGVGRAKPVAGGYRVSGRWPFGSGSPHATWFTPVCAVEEGGQPTDRIVFPFAPRKDVILHDNWHVSGLCATAAAISSSRMSSCRTGSFTRFDPSRRSRGRSIGCRPA